MRNDRTVIKVGDHEIASIVENARGVKTVYRNGVALPYTDAVISSIASEVARDGRPIRQTHNGVVTDFAPVKDRRR